MLLECADNRDIDLRPSIGDDGKQLLPCVDLRSRVRPTVLRVWTFTIRIIAVPSALDLAIVYKYHG